MKSRPSSSPRKKRLLPSWGLLGISYGLLKKYPTQLLYLIVLPNLWLTWGQLYYQNNVKNPDQRAVALFILGSGILWLIINQAPVILFAVRAAQGKALDLVDCYRQGLPYIFRMTALVLMLVLIVGTGLALYIVPGLIAMFFILQRYYLTPYYMIDNNLSIREALAACNSATRPYLLGIFDVLVLQITLVLIAAIVGTQSVVLGAAVSTFVAAISVFLLALRYQEISSSLPRSLKVK